MKTPYTTFDKVKDYLGSLDSGLEDAVETWIEGISRRMDQMANRLLVIDTIGSGEDTPIKYYDGNGRNRLTIDEVQTIEKVEIGDANGENFSEESNFIKYPANVPHYELVLKSGYFPCGIQNVKVTGDFGLFEDVPKDIELACTILVAGIIINRNSSGQVSSEKIGNYSVSYDTDQGKQDYQYALDTVSSYRRQSF